MDTKLAIHVGAELILIGGTVAYFNKQISALKKENEELNAKLQNMSQALTQHSQILSTLINNHPKLFPPNQPFQPPGNASSENRNDKRAPGSGLGQETDSHPSSVDLNPHNRVEELDTDSGNKSEVTKEDLDKELKKTYKDLHIGDKDSKDLKKSEKSEKEEDGTSRGNMGGKRKRIIRRKEI